MNKWQRINFKIRFNERSSFFIDLIIIDLLITPTIKKFKSKIDLWSIHRSIANDGHILRLNFYTISEIAKDILKHIKSDTWYDFVVREYLEATDIMLDFVGTEEESLGIEAISGGIKASPEILKSWPYYIMGVSELFLNLIQEIKRNNPINTNLDDKEQLENCYQKLREEIAKQWYEGGQHAFFHHSWAIFGYEKTKLNVIAGTIQQGITEKGQCIFILPDIFGI